MNLLMLDIETAPHKVLCWGLWDQNIAINQIEESGYTLCWAAKWYGRKPILLGTKQHSLAMHMLKDIHCLIDKADAVVHYNGTKFDMPTLNQEFVKWGFRPPSPYKQIDLLRVVRKQFRFASNKMDYVAQHLGLGRKLPHKGMDLWVACMAGDEAAWRTMERYNKRDVILLEKLYKRLLPWIEQHPNMALYTDDSRLVCTNCGSRRVQREDVQPTLTLVYQRYQCQACGKWMRSR